MDPPHFAIFVIPSGNNAVSIYLCCAHGAEASNPLVLDEILITLVMDLRSDAESWKDLP